MIMGLMNYRKGSHYFTIFLLHWVLFPQEVFNQDLCVSRKVGFSDLEGLAELDVDELSDVPQLTAKEAGDLIMAARNLTWFKDDASN